jgi:hypothetical protein
MLGFSIIKTRPVKCSGFGKKKDLDVELILPQYISAPLKVSFPNAFSIITNLSASVPDDIHMMNGYRRKCLMQVFVINSPDHFLPSSSRRVCARHFGRVSNLKGGHANTQNSRKKLCSS